jgi:hypothetical protein
MTKMPPTACTDCGGAMERGYVLDHAHHDRSMRARWVEGEPDIGMLGGLRTTSRRQIAIRAYRCTECGLLKQYAVDADEL